MEANIWRERFQSMGEEIANSVSHGIGLLGALAVTPILILHVRDDGCQVLLVEIHRAMVDRRHAVGVAVGDVGA